MTDWTQPTTQDTAYAMTRFGTHRFVEHLLAMRTATKDGSETAPSFGYGCQNFVVRDGKCYVAFGWGPNLDPGWAHTFGTDPELQGIFEFDGANITKVQGLADTCPAAFGVCLDADGNFAYDDDGWANYGVEGSSGVMGTYSGPINRWTGADNRTPRLIDGEVVFAVTYLSLNGTPRTSNAPAWMVKNTREAVIARAGSWPPVLERIDASTEIDSPTLFHALGDLRQDPQGNIWGVVLRVQDGVQEISGHINPNNYVAVVKVPTGLVGECEVWWENPDSDIPWPLRSTLELEMADPDSIFFVLNRAPYNDETHPPIAWPWNPTGFSPGNIWTSYHHQFWRLNKHSPTGHVMESSGFDSTLSGGLLRFQDVLIADNYYGTLFIRYPDGTWHEERADAGDETYLRPGDPAPPDVYADVDTVSLNATIDRSYFDYIRIGPTNGTDLYATVYYTQNAANGHSGSFHPRAGDWVRWTPSVATPVVLTAAIGPSGYYI